MRVKYLQNILCFIQKLKMFVKYLNIINFSIKKLIKTSEYLEISWWLSAF